MQSSASPHWRPVLRVCALTLLLLLSGTAAVQAQDEAEDGSELDSAVQDLLAEHFEADGPGAAVAVLKGGAVRAKAAIGLADIEAGTPIDADTVFDLASVSKQFTATAILKLAADVKLDVRKPLSVYVSDFELRSPVRQVRVADLVFHTSGLADYSSEAWDGTDAEFAALTTETHLKWINETEPLQPPGVSYVYNNSGYALLALVVERVSGQRFDAYARDRLFLPAGMKSTRVYTRLGQRFPRQATGYKRSEDGSVEASSSPSVIAGDGNVFSTVNDLIAWNQALDGNRLLSPPQRRALWARGTLDNGRAIDNDGQGYGYGWVIEGQGRVSHSGSWYGTATYLLRDNPKKIAVIVLSNDENAAVSEIAEALAALVE